MKAGSREQGGLIEDGGKEEDGDEGGEEDDGCDKGGAFEKAAVKKLARNHNRGGKKGSHQGNDLTRVRTRGAAKVDCSIENEDRGEGDEGVVANEGCNDCDGKTPKVFLG